MKVLEFDKSGSCKSINFDGDFNFVVNIICQKQNISEMEKA